MTSFAVVLLKYCMFCEMSKTMMIVISRAMA